MEDLIVKVLRELASPDEIRAVAEWRSLDPKNERAFLAMAAAWEESSGKRAVRNPKPAPSAAAIVRLANERTTQRRRSTFRRYAAIAAVMVGLLGTGTFLLSLDEIGSGEFDFENSSASAQILDLPDGSFAKLAPGARLDYREASEQRSVRLEGRGFFGVAHEPDRPFVIETESGSATVLGTRFQLEDTDSALTLIVVEGRVALESGAEPRVVTAGHVGLAGRSGSVAVDSVSNIFELLDWDDGTFVFHTTPLEQVAQEVGWYFERSITIADSVLAKREITAWFEQETFEDIMGTVCLIAGAECEFQPSGLTIKQ